MFIFSLMLVFIGTAINMVSNPIINLLFTVLSALLLSNIFFEGLFWVKITATVICVFVPVFTEIIFDYILHVAYPSDYTWVTLSHLLRILISFFEFILSFLVFYLICRFKRSKYQLNINSKIYLMIIILPVITLFSGVFIYLSGILELDHVDNKFLVGVFFIILLLVNIAHFFIFDYIAYIYSSNIHFKILHTKSKFEINYYQRLIEEYDEKRKFYHDTKNFISTAKKLLDDSNYSDLEKLLSEINSIVNSNNSVNICTNKIVNAILFDKISICKNLDISNVTVEVDFDLRLEKINTLDIVVILGNLIDNAIEASKQIENPEINIKMRNLQSEVLINVSNRFGKIHLVSGKFLSTKSNTNDHGIGLKNVIDTVERYNGYIDIKHEDSFFTVEILI